MVMFGALNDFLLHFTLMPQASKKLEEHIAFGLFGCPFICLSVCSSLLSVKTVGGFCFMWNKRMENKGTRIFSFFFFFFFLLDL